jgi:hypothetical protein
VKRTKLAPHEVVTGWPTSLEHPSHDAIAPGVQRDLHDRLAGARLADDARALSAAIKIRLQGRSRW